MLTQKIACFIPMGAKALDIVLPERFTYPFSHRPHPICILVAEEVKSFLSKNKSWQHDFGLDGNENGLGKMFGVLVVQNEQNELGYLRAFSGKVAGVNHLSNFVPPVFDMLDENGFYRIGEEEINVVTRSIEAIESSDEFLYCKKRLSELISKSEQEILDMKTAHKIAKAERKIQREMIASGIIINSSDNNISRLNNESSRQHFEMKDLHKKWKIRIAEMQAELQPYEDKISGLKYKRKEMSAKLQETLFSQYSFLNQHGENKSLKDIFKVTDDAIPPAGAGECTAPKLLQYAFLHRLKPIAMAEFWWGKSPISEIRKHEQFYPACKGKCEPILKHMLQDVEMDEDPSLKTSLEEKIINIVYEDEYLAVISKPTELLTVPGKKVSDSVYARMREKYPEATGPMIVHRLDMSTSGLLIVAKTLSVYQHLQAQFIKRKVKKRYVAILNGLLLEDNGTIELPLRVDLDDRPRQLVCNVYGKPAKTIWKVVGRKDNRTKVYFYPITGRTHQLRVHAAHPLGLNLAIMGDDLYGDKADRLYLHAAFLSFEHPITGTKVNIEDEVPF